MTPILLQDFTRDAVGNITKLYRGDLPATVYYEYDKNYRLTKETWQDTDTPPNTLYAFEYNYDNADNREQAEILGDAVYYEYENGNNRLTKEFNETQGETTYYGYDNRGNIIRKKKGTDDTYYYYDSRNLMTEAVLPTAASYFVYNALGERVRKLESSGSVY
ncbi:MAG: hypothetical protein ABIH42_08570 [Planctomycetota bacterium]